MYKCNNCNRPRSVHNKKLPSEPLVYLNNLSVFQVAPSLSILLLLILFLFSMISFLRLIKQAGVPNVFNFKFCLLPPERGLGSVDRSMRNYACHCIIDTDVSLSKHTQYFLFLSLLVGASALGTCSDRELET